MNDYIKVTKALLKKKIKKSDLEELNTKITFFQHERMIHLFVTITFIFLTIIFLALGMISYIFLIIFAILIIFDIFYIIHYFYLENSVQYLYKLYDELNEKLKKENKEQQ